MKPVDVVWFESMSTFNEQVFDLILVKLSLKQLVIVLAGVVIAYAISKYNLYAGIGVLAVTLVLAFVRPKVMSFEQYLLAALAFSTNRSRRQAAKRKAVLSSLAAQRAEKRGDSGNRRVEQVRIA